MKSALIILIILAGLAGLVFYFLNQSENQSTESQPGKIVAKNMRLTSPAFDNNQLIPAKYTCDGEDINPPLEISQVPAEAKSLVLIVDDPDAPMGTWLHWLVWNINPGVSSIAENTRPSGGREGINDFGKRAYGGPCPPGGRHRYFFKLYALDKTLELDDSSKKEDLKKAMEGAVLDSAELIGWYSRQNQ